MIKTYLVLGNVILAIFAIWFSNVGFLPFKNAGDFGFFVVLTLVLALYRPGWAFTLFIGMLALENVNLAAEALGMQIRPFQLLFFVSFLALIGRYLTKKMPFSLPKGHWIDVLPLLFVAGGFLSMLAAVNTSISFKQSIVAVSFVGMYFLARIFVQSFEDLKRIVPFFLSTGIVVCLYAIWQNFAFSHGWKSFEVMPGRPNGTFVEADWLGIYLVALLSIILAIIFYQSKKTRISNFQETKTKQISNSNLQMFKYFGYSNFGDWVMFVFCHLYLVILLTALILTVSRSAWIGGIIVVLGYLKLVLLYGENESQKSTTSFWSSLWTMMKQKWNWKGWIVESLKMVAILVLSLVIIFVFKLTNFQLGSRAQSSAGLQKITIACANPDIAIPERINSLDDLSNYNCRHINLEDIQKEESAGNIVREVFRPDPNVGIRAKIYQISFDQIKAHPVMGIGWGSISQILGTDSRGAGLNASNLFLEVWLGSGLLGFLSIVILFGWICILSISKFVKRTDIGGLVFVMLGLFAIIIPNLFNSGIFLGFVWVFLGVAVGLLLEKKN